MSSVDVCLVSYGSGALLARAVRSVREQIPEAGIRVVEHHPHGHILDETRLAVAGLEVELTADQTNPGFGAGCNRLAASATADWLVFLNPDATVVAWPGIEQFRAGRIIGPWMGSDAATRHHSGRRWTVIEHVRRAWLRRPGPPPTDGEGFVSGAAMLVARADFERVGGFDERYFMYYEDIDLCRRAGAIGIGTELCCDWVVAHEGAHASRRDLAGALLRSHRSALLYHRTHGGSVVGYLCLVTLDSSLRTLWFAARRDVASSTAYRSLARIASGALARSACGGRSSASR